MADFALRLCSYPPCYVYQQSRNYLIAIDRVDLHHLKLYLWTLILEEGHTKAMVNIAGSDSRNTQNCR